MSQSEISSPAYFSNAPEVQDFKVEFVYNFYEKSESSRHPPLVYFFDNNPNLTLDDPGLSLPQTGPLLPPNSQPQGPGSSNQTQTSEKIIKGENIIKSKRSKLSRYNYLSWKFPIYLRPQNGSNILSANLDTYKKIIKEGLLRSSGGSSVTLSTENITNKVFNLAESLRVSVGISDLSQIGIDEKISSFDINQPIKEGFSAPSNSLLFNNFSFGLRVWDSFSSTDFQFDDLSQFDRELGGLSQVEQREEDSIGTNFLNDKIFGILATYPPSNQILHQGFIVKRREVLSNGDLTDEVIFIINDPTLREFIDYQIIYGKSYTYEISSVFSLFVPMVREGGIVFAKILISSSDQRAFIDSEENIAPPPPDHIRFSWDRTKNEMQIGWNMPFNTQRDIKRFQILRRQSINHPFEIVQEFRFNDNEEPTIARGVPEEIPADIIKVAQNTKYPEKSWVDKDFSLRSKYIYALCSIDAHFYTSNISAQFEVYFNRSKNRLEKRLISEAGAPKPYPNLYIPDDEIFVSSLMTSGKKSRKIHAIFSPDFFSVKDSAGTKIQDLEIGNGEKYKMKILNLDNQETKFVNFTTKQTV